MLTGRQEPKSFEINIHRAMSTENELKYILIKTNFLVGRLSIEYFRIIISFCEELTESHCQNPEVFSLVTNSLF